MLFVVLLLMKPSAFSFLLLSKISFATSPEHTQHLLILFYQSMLLTLGYLLFSAFRNIAFGVLSAAGDSKFLSLVGSLSVWVFLLLPTYLFVVKTQQSVVVAQTVLMLYGALVGLIYFARYQMGSWRKNCRLVEVEQESSSL